MFSTTPSLIEMSIETVVEMLPMFPSERVSVVRIGNCGASVTLGGGQIVCLGYLPMVDEKRINGGCHPGVDHQC